MTSTPPPELEFLETPRNVVPRNLALGIERIGFIPLSHRLISVIVFVVLCALAAVGFTRLKVDDSLSQLFRSDTAEFKTYEDVTHRFPSTEFDVLVVVEGPTLLERSSLEKLRDLVIDLQLIDGTRGVISLFSARQPPENGQIPAPLFPNPLPTGAEYQDLIAKVKANEIIRGKLLSNDGKLALIVLALDPAATRNNLSKVIGEVRQSLNENLAGTGLSGELSGVPVMQLETRTAIERDRLFYNALGFLAGCLIAALFFRRLAFMIIAAAPPLAAILLALGTLGWLDFRLNIFLNVMTPLIMVISFSDSMQLTFAARDRLIMGDDKFTAFRNALLIAGPACVLTHATAGISFIALQFSSSDLIRTFGEAGLIATLIALVAVITLVPLLGVLLIRNEAGFAASVRGMDKALDVLRRFCSWIAVRMVTHPGLYTLAGLLVVVALSVGYSQLQPHYRLADQVPDRQQAVAASRRLDVKLTGANPIDVLIEFPQGKIALRPRNARGHRRRAFDAGAPGRRRQRLVGGDAAALAGGKDGQDRRRHAQAIRRLAAALSDAAVHFGQAGRGHRQRPRPRRRRQQAFADRRRPRQEARRAQGQISRLYDRGHRPVGDRRAQQRQS